MIADISCSQLVVWFLAETPCRDRLLLWDDWQWEVKLLRLCRQHTVCSHMCSYTLLINIPKYVCMFVCQRWVRVVWLSPPIVHGIRAKMLLKRLVVNMQPTSSAIFSRMLKSDSVSALFVFLFCAFMLCGCVCSHGAPYLSMKCCSLWLPPWVRSIKALHHILASLAVRLCRSVICAHFWQALLLCILAFISWLQLNKDKFWDLWLGLWVERLNNVTFNFSRLEKRPGILRQITESTWGILSSFFSLKKKLFSCHLLS